MHGLWGFYETADTVHGKPIGHITQHYSHFTLEADLYFTTEPFSHEAFEWFSLEEIEELSLSRADHKAVALLRYNL